MSWNIFFSDLSLLLFLVQHPTVEIRNVNCWSHAINHGSGLSNPPSVSPHTNSPVWFSFPLPYIFFQSLILPCFPEPAKNLKCFFYYVKLSAPYTSKCLCLMAALGEWPHSWSHWRLKMYVWLLKVLVVPNAVFFFKKKKGFVKLQWLSWALSFP